MKGSEMPFVSSGFFASFLLIDTGNDKSTKTYALQSADFAAALVDTAAIEDALTPITTARIRSYTISQKFEEDAFTYPTLAEVENQAEIIVQLQTLNKFATIYIPAPTPAIFVSGSGNNFNVVDGTDTLVQNYLALFNENAQAYLSDGEFINATVGQRFQSGKRIHRASRNG